MGFLLNVRLRALPYFFAVIPAVLLAPSHGGRGGWEAFASPMGAVLASALLLVAGTMLEARGGVLAIRGGAAIRVLAALGLVGAMVFAFATARSVRLEHVEGWTWPVSATFAAYFVFCVVHDVGVAIDPRFGRAIRLIALDATSIRLRSRAGEITIPLTAVRSVRAQHWRDAWFVTLELESRERVAGPVDSLPWRPRNAQSRSLELTEHDLAMTASEFATRVTDGIERAALYR